MLRGGSVHFESDNIVAHSAKLGTGCRKLLFHCCHNVSRQQLDEGISYLQLMEQNLNTLREVLG